MDVAEPHQHPLTTAALRLAVLAGVALPILLAVLRHDPFVLFLLFSTPTILRWLAAATLEWCGAHVDRGDAYRPGEQMQFDLPNTYEPVSAGWEVDVFTGVLGGMAAVVAVQTLVSISGPMAMYGISVAAFFGIGGLVILASRRWRRTLSG